MRQFRVAAVSEANKPSGVRSLSHDTRQLHLRDGTVHRDGALETTLVLVPINDRCLSLASPVSYTPPGAPAQVNDGDDIVYLTIPQTHTAIATLVTS